MRPFDLSLYAGGWMQQPVRQNWVPGHAGKQLTPQGFCPCGHAGVGHDPPAPPEPLTPPEPPAFCVPPPPFVPPPPGGFPPLPAVPPPPGAPPVPEGVHDGGNVSLPTQSSHVPQVLLHWAL